MASWQAILSQLGLDIEHRWQVATGQVASDTEGKTPGFYYAEALWEFEGTFNAVISQVYGTIAKIDFQATDENGVITEVIVPTS